MNVVLFETLVAQSRFATGQFETDGIGFRAEAREAGADPGKHAANPHGRLMKRSDLTATLPVTQSYLLIRPRICRSIHD
jgi:hypothetical protein